MDVFEIRDLLNEFQAQGVVNDARLDYFRAALAEIRQDVHLNVRDADILRVDMATAIERFALDTNDRGDQRSTLFEEAFLCRRVVDLDQLAPNERLIHLAYLCADGVLAEKRAELMMLLRSSETRRALELSTQSEWSEELLLRICRAFVLLCRKGGGWDDVRDAAQEIERLRDLQRRNASDLPSRAALNSQVAADLVANFNLAKLVDIVARYTINGEPQDAPAQIERHSANIVEIMRLAPNPNLLHVADLISSACDELLRSTVWFNTRRLGRRMREFVDLLTNEGRPRPVFELWPSQREALNSSLLDPAKRAIVVEMPTSAGKTLIAEFSVVQALALNPGGKVAYVVPTRALVNQIVLRLRADLGPLGYAVEAAVPVFELDPTEDQLLRQKIDVLVVTPEKLDLLIRSGHPSIDSLALVVADEAHNIGDGDRGARLELLLGTIKRERADTRFLLLTPFVPNGNVLASWLGDDGEGTIQVTWRPSERIAAAALWQKPRNRPYELVLQTLPSAQNVDLTEEVPISLGPSEIRGSRSKERIAISAALKMADRGGVLFLARGRGTAESRAASISEQRDPRQLSSFGESVIRYVQSELGEDHELPSMLRRGVTYHHAGLSHDVRYLLELLIDRGDVEVVCGTTTLAQGVNFPIATVVVETLKKSMGIGRGWSDLTYSEFWNIAGRAGRALRDRVGLVAFPARNNADIDEARSFLRGEAAALASVLLEALEQLSSAQVELNLGFVRNNRELAVFLQYLTHAIRVAGASAGATEIEDILRSSLVYHQAREQSRSAAEKLIRLTRRFTDQISGRESGFLSLADGTGFSLYSVDYLYAKQRSEYPEFANVEFWEPGNLFSGRGDDLASIISVLGDVPELTLGRPVRGIFNPQRVAGIVTDWVNGSTVSDIADRWFSDIDDSSERSRAAGHYLYSQLVGQVPWGIGAMQQLALAGRQDLTDVAHVPSLVFYGVSNKEAAALRMAGVPRAAAVGLSDMWRGNLQATSSFEEIREWVASRSSEEWSTVLPSGGPLTGEDCRTVWNALVGAAG
jgi:RAD3-like DEAD/DEAH box helicase